MEYQISFPRRIAKQGEIIRVGGIFPRKELRVGYVLDLDNLLRVGGVNLDAAAADFLEVMFAVFKADRICPREAGHLAPRSMDVRIPVRVPDLWNSPAVKASLRSLLFWLSGDDWQFRFSRRQDEPLWVESQRGFWSISGSETDVLLNSGGLDSLIGLAQWSARNNNHRLIAVTTGPSELARLAGEIVGRIRSVWEFSRWIDVLGIEEEIQWQNNPRCEQESSWRTRALFPLAVGIVAAHSAGASKLQVFENGIGAIALPMTPDHEGVGATRSMQPRTLRLFSELASEVLGHRLHVVNNGLFMTKRQGVVAFLPSSLAQSVLLTHSCPQWSYTRRPCGKCTSCILRQMALQSTRFQEMAVPAKRGSLEFEAMAYQVEHLRAELSDEATEFIHSSREVHEAVRYTEFLGHDQADAAQSLKELYKAHIQEFDAYNLDISPAQTSTKSNTVLSPESLALSA